MKNPVLNTTYRSLGVLGVLVAMIGLVTLAGCNTWKGAGEDVERTGEVMQGE